MKYSTVPYLYASRLKQDRSRRPAQARRQNIGASTNLYDALRMYSLRWHFLSSSQFDRIHGVVGLVQHKYSIFGRTLALIDFLSFSSKHHPLPTRCWRQKTIHKPLAGMEARCVQPTSTSVNDPSTTVTEWN